MAARFSAVLVTYRRPNLLPIAFERLDSQTRRPDRLVIVDNDPYCGARKTVQTSSLRDVELEYLSPGENLGPAGGFALGMQTLLPGAADEDAILLLDDNDPLPPFDIIGQQLSLLDRLSDADPHAAGVGTHGATFDWRRARIRRMSGLDRGTVLVDHLHGGGYPLYRISAIRQVGGFSAQLFFGFEELEFGLRLKVDGLLLYVNGALNEQQRTWRRRELVTRLRPALGLDGITWRRYYSLRNLLHILLIHGHQGTAAKIAAVRGVGKPVANVLVAPRSAADHLGWNRRAISDAFAGRMGRTVEPTY
jgi:glycosyltransferase involved in cell wall biosynthesis